VIDDVARTPVWIAGLSFELALRGLAALDPSVRVARDRRFFVVEDDGEGGGGSARLLCFSPVLDRGWMLVLWPEPFDAATPAGVRTVTDVRPGL
jgi:hypothetical protein